MSRPHCQKPRACRAKGAGHCRSCNLKQQHADPVFKAAQSKRSSEHMRRLHADPTFKAATAQRAREHMQKIWALAKTAKEITQ